MDAQADLILSWAQIPHCCFSNGAAHIIMNCSSYHCYWFNVSLDHSVSLNLTEILLINWVEIQKIKVALFCLICFLKGLHCFRYQKGANSQGCTRYAKLTIMNNRRYAQLEIVHPTGTVQPVNVVTYFRQETWLKGLIVLPSPVLTNNYQSICHL